MCRGCCRYCEVSAALNHRVDELLVQIVNAVRQSSPRRQAIESATTDTGPQQSSSAVDESSVPAATCVQDSSDIGCVRSAAIMLKGLFTKQKSPPASKSRENLIDWMSAVPLDKLHLHLFTPLNYSVLVCSIYEWEWVVCWLVNNYFSLKD